MVTRSLGQLFGVKDLSRQLAHRREQVLLSIEKIVDGTLLGDSQVGPFVAKSLITPLDLGDWKAVPDHQPYTMQYQVEVPFRGEEFLLSYTPERVTADLPEGYVFEGKLIRFKVAAADDDPRGHRSERVVVGQITNNLALLKAYVASVNRQVASYNADLEGVVRTGFRDRVARLKRIIALDNRLRDRPDAQTEDAQ